jgi:prolyl oligopeptidase
MERIPAQLAKITQVRLQDNPFYEPFVAPVGSLSHAEAQALAERAERLVKDVVVPAYQKFEAFFNERYLPAARVDVGVGSLANGKALYEFAAQRFTTTNLTPQQIHDIGLAEVARIRAAMEEIITEVGFDGDLQAFNEFLRTDPQFYYDNADDLYDQYRVISKRIDPELVKLFGRLPRIPYGVRPIPEQIAPDTTTAYYMPPAADGSRAGYYYVNLYRPEVRPKFEMEVLSVHEAMPGHHLQIALARELEGLPMFRKIGGATAFVEGWGLYSERLGYELGLYQDPYSRYGQLVYDMWRAVRLVVDTGMHYLGWSRQEAIDYFMANAAKTEADIINEIDRYIGWPGQALAYKIGQLKILELRARAEQELGDRFDIRAFHDHLLGAGALPLNLLEQRMNTWMADD